MRLACGCQGHGGKTLRWPRECMEAQAEIERKAAAYDAAAACVNNQAEDPRLWFVARTAAEAYLQQELGRLHAVIEQDAEHAATSL